MVRRPRPGDQPARGRKHRPLPAAAIVIGALLLTAYFLLLGPELQDFAYQVPGMLAVVAVMAGLAIHRPSNPRPWLLLAAGLMLTTTGDWTWVVLERGFGIEPFPSVADAFYLTGFALTGLAILWLVRHRIPDGDRAGLIDALIVTVGAGLLNWTFLLGPIVADTEATAAETAFAAAYPLLDLLILGVLVRIALAPGRRVPALTSIHPRWCARSDFAMISSAPSASASSSSTTSRWSTSRPVPWPASRRSSGGVTRRAGCWRRGTSSAWRKRPAPSSASVSGSSPRRAARVRHGAMALWPAAAS